MATSTSLEPRLLARANVLAERGRGATSPNPLVGAVVARDGEVLGEGWHAAAGELHAERAALADCERRGNDPAGADVFVTLEPCAHHGRQPPCTDALIEAEIARVVYASEDPSAKANGRGVELLRAAGIECVMDAGAEREVAIALNQPFRKHSTTGLPLVIYKAATTVDGRTATSAGESHWISGADSRRLVHRWRADYDAVAVGIGTALADDPQLTARDLPAGDTQLIVQPTRVVFDSTARLPLDSALVRSARETPLVIVAADGADSGRVAALEAAGVEVLVAGGAPAQRVSVALARLGERGLSSVLLEGGAALAGAFGEAGEIDQLRLFIAPLLMGGEGPGLMAGAGATALADAPRAELLTSEPVGEDLLINAWMKIW